MGTKQISDEMVHSYRKISQLSFSRCATKKISTQRESMQKNEYSLYSYICHCKCKCKCKAQVQSAKCKSSVHPNAQSKPSQPSRASLSYPAVRYMQPSRVHDMPCLPFPILNPIHVYPSKTQPVQTQPVDTPMSFHHSHLEKSLLSGPCPSADIPLLCP